MSGTTTEANSFDGTVAQYETTDPVLGASAGGGTGAANAPIINLTNRTRYLYNQVVTINEELPLLAPLASPVFTGNVQMLGGEIELGSLASPSTPYLDLHSSGYANDYDVRLIASGGANGTSGRGSATIYAGGGITFTGQVTSQGAPNGFVVGTIPAGNAAAFFANLPAGYSSYIIQLGIAGNILFFVDSSGNAGITGGLSVTGAISSSSNLSLSGYANVAGNGYIQGGTLTVGGQSSTAANLWLRSFGSGSNGFDVQLAATGGTSGSNGGGRLGITAATVTFSGTALFNGTVTTSSAGMGFSVAPNGVATGDTAAFYVNVPATYTYDPIACRVGGALVFATDKGGNTGMTGTLTVGGNATVEGTISAGVNISALGGINANGNVQAGGNMVAAGGELVLGEPGASPEIAFVSAPNGTPNAYDAAIVSNGGTAGKNGQGILSILAAALMVPPITGTDSSQKAASTAFASGVLNLAGKAADGQSRGHQILPSGLILQWGFDGMNNSTTNNNPTGQDNTFNFDMQFPNECLGVVLCEAAANGWFNNPSSPDGPAPTLYGVNSVNTTGFAASVVGFTALANGTVNLHTSTSASFFFIALGF